MKNIDMHVLYDVNNPKAGHWVVAAKSMDDARLQLASLLELDLDQIGGRRYVGNVVHVVATLTFNGSLCRPHRI